MMKSNQTLAAIVLTLPLLITGLGCARAAPPQRTMQVSNQAYKLDELFTDPRGYTVYRFFDDGDYRYYVVGPGGAQMLPTTKTVTESTADSPEIIFVQRSSDHGHKK